MRDLPLCDLHKDRWVNSSAFVGAIGLTTDTCWHCAREWSDRWKQLLSDNPWFGDILPGDVIYIAGPMSGLPENNHPAFRRMEHALKLRYAQILSPIYHDDPKAEYESLLRQALQKLLAADKVVMLAGWNDSKGANLEHHVALGLKMPIFYEI